MKIKRYKLAGDFDIDYCPRQEWRWCVRFCPDGKIILFDYEPSETVRIRRIM